MKTLFLPVFSRLVAAVAAGALFGGGAAFAQAPTIPNSTGAATPAEKPKPLAYTDQTYLRNTLKSLYYQVQLANAAKSLTDIGLSRLRDDTAKNLGAALEALGKIATAHGEKMPAEITGNEKVDFDRVTKAKPDKLAKEWAGALAKESKHLDHETSLAEKTLQDPDLKTFITNYGPSIRSTFTSAEAADKAQKTAH
jgi:hypothetical protein